MNNILKQSIPFTGWSLSSWRLWLWCLSLKSSQNLLHSPWRRRTWNGTYWSVGISIVTFKKKKKSECWDVHFSAESWMGCWLQESFSSSLVLISWMVVFTFIPKPCLPCWPSSVCAKPHSAICFLSKRWTLRADNTAFSPEHRSATQVVWIYPMEHSYFLKGG